MHKYEMLADIVFAAKTDQLPQSAVESHPDLLSELDFCVTVSNAPYGIVRPSTELLGALYIKAQREFNFNGTDSWKELSGFILKILEHFDSTHRGLIEDDLIQYIISDRWINNISFDDFCHPEIVGERNKKVYFTAVLQNIYKWKVANEAMLQTIRTVAAIKRINWLKTLYQASAVDHREAFRLATCLIENGVSPSDTEIFKCILCGIASHDISQYLSFFEGVIKVRQLKWVAFHAFGYAKNQPIESLKQVLDLIDLNPENDVKDQCGLCFTYLSYVSLLPKEGDLSQRVRASLMMLAACQNVEVLDCLVDNLYLGAQPADIVYSILKELIDNPAHRREYYEVVNQSVGRFDAILALEQGEECLFFDFLALFITKTGISFKIDSFAVSLDIYLKNNDAVRQFIVRCLSSNIGKVRYLGNILFNEVIKKFGELDFTEEVKSITENEKIVLILSIKFFPPLYFSERFKILIPIIKQNKEVTNILISKFVVSTVEDFPSLISVLESEFGNHDDWKSNLELLNNFKLSSSKLYLERQKIKELSPQYIYPKLFRHHQRLHFNKFSEDISKGVWEKSIFNTIGTKIQLLKGGGYKIDSNSTDSIQKLNRVEASFSIPTSIYRNPELDNLTLTHYFSSNFESEEHIKEWLLKFL